MAVSKQSDYSTSFLQGCDEVQEMYCEHCDKREKKYIPAEGFCVDCVEYMCDTCLKYHKWYLTSHMLKDKESMPQDFCLEKCSIHKDEIIKFYCQACQIFACSECKTNDHRNCKTVSHLPTLVDGIEKSKELKDLTEHMDELLQELEMIKENADTMLERATSQERKILEKLKMKKKEIVSAYNMHQQKVMEEFEMKMEETITRLKEEKKTLVKQSEDKRKKLENKLTDEEDEIKKKVSNTKEVDQKQQESIKEKSLIIRNDLKKISFDLEQLQATGQRCKLFIEMKKAKKGFGKLEHDSSKLKENSNIHYYTSECTVKKQDIRTIEHTDRVFSFKEVNQSEIERRVHTYCNLESELHSFSSLCLLSEHTLLVTAFDHSSLIIFKDMKVSTTSYNTVQMPSGPWAATKVEDNKVAITLPFTGTVRLMTFSDGMTVVNSECIEVGQCCRGIAYCDNNLIVSYTTTPAKVQILDMSGTVLKSFHKDCNGQQLFAKPFFLTLNPDNTIIYVSDQGKNMVLSMTFDGKVKAIYKDDQLPAPCQMTVDKLGAVYVCGYQSDNVHQLSSDLKKVKILLDGRQGIQLPLSVAYCQNNNRLYIGMHRENYINVSNVTLE